MFWINSTYYIMPHCNNRRVNGCLNVLLLGCLVLDKKCSLHVMLTLWVVIVEKKLYGDWVGVISNHKYMGCRFT